MRARDLPRRSAWKWSIPGLVLVALLAAFFNPPDPITAILVLRTGSGEGQIMQLEETCRAQITKKLREWSVTSISADVAKWNKSHRLDPTLVYGDFDGDSHPDIAILIQNRATPVLDYPDRAYSSLVAVCLTRRTVVVLHLIDNPYCSDLIELSRKGRRYWDFESHQPGTYRFDGVKTVCFEKASATYVYNPEGAGFRRIIDGD